MRCACVVVMLCRERVSWYPVVECVSKGMVKDKEMAWWSETEGPEEWIWAVGWLSARQRAGVHSV